MYKRILVPLDGSTRAEHAIPVAARIARASGGTVDLLRVVYPPVDYGIYLTQSQTLVDKEIDAAIDAATEYLVGMARSDALQGVDTKIEAITGAVAPTLLSYSESAEIDLIVMCSHGYTGLKRWMLGSVAEKVVRHTLAPVLLLRENGPTLIAAPADQPVRALVALDGSSLSEAVLEPTIALLAGLSPSAHGVHLLRVVEAPALDAIGKSQANSAMNAIGKAREEAASYLKSIINALQTGIGAGTQLKCTSSVISDVDVVGAIVKESQHVEHTAATAAEGTNGYTFIAMSTHGRGSMEHWMSGNTTERTLHGSQLPLLIVRPQLAEYKADHTRVNALHINA